MEMNEIRIGDVLRNTHTSKLFLVKNTAAKKLFLEDEVGHPIQFAFIGQFEAANDEEKARYAKSREDAAPKKVVKVLGVYDEAETRTLFAEYAAKLKPETAPAFSGFWAQVLEVIGDKPGQTWRMRKSKGAYNPVVRVNSAAGNWVDGLLVFADAKEGAALSLVVMREHMPAGSEALFPEKALYGQGREMALPYAELSPEKLAPYLDVIRALTAKKAVAAAAAGPA